MQYLFPDRHYRNTSTKCSPITFSSDLNLSLTLKLAVTNIERKNGQINMCSLREEVRKEWATYRNHTKLLCMKMSFHFLLQLFFQAFSYCGLSNTRTVVSGQRHNRETQHNHLLSWKSLVKNFSTLLQNFAERFSLAVAIMIWTNSPLYDEGENKSAL